MSFQVFGLPVSRGVAIGRAVLVAQDVALIQGERTALALPVRLDHDRHFHRARGPEAARAVAGATQGVMPVAVSRPQNQAIKPGAHAPEDHHHQQ